MNPSIDFDAAKRERDFFFFKMAGEVPRSLISIEAFMLVSLSYINYGYGHTTVSSRTFSFYF